MKTEHEFIADAAVQIYCTLLSYPQQLESKMTVRTAVTRARELARELSEAVPKLAWKPISATADWDEEIHAELVNITQAVEGLTMVVRNRS